jgi:outer membrane protein, heavy metal efflux system
MSSRRRSCVAVALVLLGRTLAAAEMPRSPAPTDLPAAAAVERALQESPRLRIAIESIARGAALERRFRAGPHEWELQSLSQQRKDASGATHSEQEYGVQSGFRWPWKASLDRRIGRLARESGELSYFDAWHEAGRNLLELWFAWVQAEHSARLLALQERVLLQQQEAVAKRVAAGDAARLELQLTEAETQRLRASRSAALRDAGQAREALQREFPGLPLELPAELAMPVELADDDGAWISRIVTDNHEVELAAARRDEAELAAERAVGNRLADPTIGLRYTTNLGGERRVIGLNISVPIGGAGRTADAALARSDARRAGSELQRTMDYVNAAARSALGDARRSYASWMELLQAHQQMLAATDATARGYALGEFDISAMLAARRNALQTEQELLGAQLRANWSYARVLLDAHQLWLPPGHEPAAGSE